MAVANESGVVSGLGGGLPASGFGLLGLIRARVGCSDGGDVSLLNSDSAAEPLSFVEGADGGGETSSVNAGGDVIGCGWLSVRLSCGDSAFEKACNMSSESGSVPLAPLLSMSCSWVGEDASMPPAG